MESEKSLSVSHTSFNQDRVSRVVEDAIENFAVINESHDIKNITEEYTPLVIDKIFEKSDKIVLVDTTNEFFDKYPSVINELSSKPIKITIYSSGSEPFLKGKSEVEFHHLTSLQISQLSINNIRNVVIGDSERFIWGKSEEKPSYKRFKNALKNLFSKSVDDVVKIHTGYQSLTNFCDEGKAHGLLQIIAQVTSNHNSQQI